MYVFFLNFAIQLYSGDFIKVSREQRCDQPAATYNHSVQTGQIPWQETVGWSGDEESFAFRHVQGFFLRFLGIFCFFLQNHHDVSRPDRWFFWTGFFFTKTSWFQ